MSDARTCDMTDCDTSHYARGWCKRHYSRWLRTGDPNVTWDPHTNRTVYTDPVIRFWSKVDRAGADDCWLWKASTTRGYGTFSRFGGTRGSNRGIYAHRFSYELARGPIPDGLTVDHLCQTPRCVNPAHMELVTASENARRVVLRRTHCKRGHEYSPENTYVRPDGGGRQCRTCNAARSRRRAS